jgi:hypothetical protein
MQIVRLSALHCLYLRCVHVHMMPECRRDMASREMGGHCKTSVKVFVPQRTVMGCSRGKLLGTRGSMLKQLMQV